MSESDFIERPRMERWWWASVPYSLAFTVAVLGLQPSPWTLRHLLFLAVFTFWLTLLSSVVWTLVSLRLSFLNLDDARSGKRMGMLAAALPTCAFGIAWTFGWYGT